MSQGGRWRRSAGGTGENARHPSVQSARSSVARPARQGRAHRVPPGDPGRRSADAATPGDQSSRMRRRHAADDHLLRGTAEISQTSSSPIVTSRLKKVGPYSITERRVSELIPVLGSQPAGDVSHKPGGRLPLLSARPAVTPATLKRAATSFAAW